MTREELRAWLLTRDGMVFIRKTIIEHYSWFIHTTDWRYVDDIRRDGLRPNNPDPSREVPNEVMTELGDRVVCLNPIGSPRAQSSSTGKLFRVGLRAADLPQRLGLDWSYPESWELRNITNAQISRFGKDGAILYTVNGTGSIVSYLPVQSSVLRVCTHEKNPDFPCTWPMLVDVANDQILTT